MSKPWARQAPDVQSKVLEIPLTGIILAAGNTVPTDAATGYAPGCIFIDVNALAGAQIFINEGTKASSDFNAFVPVSQGQLAVSATSLVINEDSTDMDLRMESNAVAAFLNVDGSGLLNGQVSIGAAVPTNPQAMLALLPPANATGVTANQSVFHATILPGGATTIPTGTAPVVASLNIHEPNITATGTVTDAATLRVVDAPTEGGTNWAIWSDAGANRFDGTCYIGDTANAVNTLGLTINQGTADDEILTLKSADVAHGVTSVSETDTYGMFRKHVAAEGGLQIVGLGEAQQGMRLYAIGTTADVTDAPTTTSEAICEVVTALADTANVQASGATGNIFQVMNTTTNEFIVKGDGELYSNQSATVGTFDDHDDAILCADLSYVLSNEYQKIIRYNEAILEQLGMLGPKDENGGRMYSLTKLTMLTLCACGQIGRQLQAVAEKVGLKLTNDGALALGGGS